MILYHGSNMDVIQPKILKSSRLLDFGSGFHTTSSYEQATRWADKVCARNGSGSKYLSVFRFDLELARTSLKLIEFTRADEDWLAFVTANRRGAALNSDYDIVIGPVADDSVYLTISLFERGLLDTPETIKRLKTEKLFNQVLFHTERSLDYLLFDRMERL